MSTAIRTPWVVALVDGDVVGETAWLVPAGIGREKLVSLLVPSLAEAALRATAEPPPRLDGSALLVARALDALAARKAVTPLPLVPFARRDPALAALWAEADRLIPRTALAGEEGRP
ncbi:MAG: hypothetical protein NZ761_12700 [Dehalococcoidia bacterium]|nr:hypothetical protein [Dehalococcoidia bacterium]